MYGSFRFILFYDLLFHRLRFNWWTHLSSPLTSRSVVLKEKWTWNRNRNKSTWTRFFPTKWDTRVHLSIMYDSGTKMEFLGSMFNSKVSEKKQQHRLRFDIRTTIWLFSSSSFCEANIVSLLNLYKLNIHCTKCSVFAIIYVYVCVCLWLWLWVKWTYLKCKWLYLVRIYISF